MEWRTKQSTLEHENDETESVRCVHFVKTMNRTPEREREASFFSRVQNLLIHTEHKNAEKQGIKLEKGKRLQCSSSNHVKILVSFLIFWPSTRCRQHYTLRVHQNEPKLPEYTTTG